MSYGIKVLNDNATIHSYFELGTVQYTAGSPFKIKFVMWNYAGDHRLLLKDDWTVHVVVQVDDVDADKDDLELEVEAKNITEDRL